MSKENKKPEGIVKMGWVDAIELNLCGSADKILIGIEYIKAIQKTRYPEKGSIIYLDNNITFELIESTEKILGILKELDEYYERQNKEDMAEIKAKMDMKNKEEIDDDCDDCEINNEIS